MKARVCLIISTLLAWPVQAWSQPAVPAAPHFDFEDGASGWMVLGEGGQISATTGPGSFKGGKAALKFDYDVRLVNPTAILAPVEVGALASCTKIDFWIKPSVSAPFALALQEKDGGRYAAFFTATGGAWQEVNVAPADLSLLRGDDDPVDPDDRLDLDQVEAIGLIDVTQIFIHAPGPDIFKMKDGPRTVYLDDFSVLTTGAPAPPAVPTLDDMTSPQPQWLGLGSLALSNVKEKPLPGNSLQWESSTSGGSITALLKLLPRRVLSKATTINFQIASSSPGELVFAVETADGGKYNTPIHVTGGERPQKLSIELAALLPAEDSKSPLKTLDAKNAKQIIIADATGMETGTASANTIWIGPMTLGID